MTYMLGSQAWGPWVMTHISPYISPALHVTSRSGYHCGNRLLELMVKQTQSTQWSNIYYVLTGLPRIGTSY